jgi:hypothetical protein
MTEMQAAIGRIQLRKLPEWTRIRRENMSHLFDALESHPALRVPRPGPNFGHAAYKAYVYLRPERLKEGWNRDRIMIEVANQGVPCFSGSCSEIYREKAFILAGLGPASLLPEAQRMGEISLMLLVHPTLAKAQLHSATQKLGVVLDRATKPTENPS